MASITIPDSVTSIGGGAFCECYHLASITIPSTITSIDYGTFESCRSLASIAIPSSVTSIGGKAFEDCANLTDVYYGGAETNRTCKMKIGGGNSELTNAVWHYRGLFSGTCGDNLTWALDGGTLTICGAGNMENYTCKGKNAPWGSQQENTQTVVIGSGVTSIGVEAFSWCRNLTSIIILNSVTSIGDGAFSGCNSLTSVIIPDSVTSIGEGAFSGCSSLKKVYVYYGGAKADKMEEIPIGEYLAHWLSKKF